ncbi:lipopolysaccharide biosynthesis protein [Porcipelethomonas sp.]|uniref:lipopolysaccharide biosynthesis protein n=1 Tax=Porcipelethomonas sp. TaxID=2981675 RepID=UPI003EF6BBE7
MNKYKNLAFNTIVFAIGSFGSKILAMFLTRLYTTYMSSDMLGTKELIETTANFLIPVFTFAMSESIIRYGLDRDYDNRQVLSTAIMVEVMGLFIMALLSPFLSLIPFIKGFTPWLVVYVIVSSFRQTFSLFVRSIGYVKLYSFDGILATLTLFIFNIIFISGFKMGITGSLIAVIASDFCSAVFLFIAAGLGKYFRIRWADRDVMKTMLRFSIPMIPTSVMWIITGFSDRIFIKYMDGPVATTGDSAAGIYTAASKIPNLVSMVSTVFFQAWNMSAITEYNSKDIGKFYQKVYSAYQSIMYIASAFLILLVKPLSAILLNYNNHPEYKQAFQYTPVLILSVLMMCFNLFLSSIYTAAQHTKNSFWTSLISTVLNLILNAFLIKRYGIYGAVATTFISYLICYLIRIVDARRYIYFKVNHLSTFINIAVLLGMSILTIKQPPYYIPCLIFMTIFIVSTNFSAIISTVKNVLSKRKG